MEEEFAPGMKAKYRSDVALTVLTNLSVFITESNEDVVDNRPLEVRIGDKVNFACKDIIT